VQDRERRNRHADNHDEFLSRQSRGSNRLDSSFSSESGDPSGRFEHAGAELLASEIPAFAKTFAIHEQAIIVQPAKAAMSP
jgi:hypothetical protein